jgi:hypothetical protein
MKSNLRKPRKKRERPRDEYLDTLLDFGIDT